MKTAIAPLPNLLQLVGILDNHLHAEIHLRLAQVNVEQRDLGVLDRLGHALRRALHIQRVAVEQARVVRGLAVRLENVDRVDRVNGGTVLGRGLDGAHGIHDHVGKEFSITAGRNRA